MKKIICLSLLCIIELSLNILIAAELVLKTEAFTTEVHVKSWKELRDEHIVKQDLDYSCGAASTATILNGFYGLDVTEKGLLDLMEDDGTYSFRDLSEVVTNYGMKGVGLALGFDELKKLKIPAIAYMKYRDNDHFSVIRGVSENGTVLLGDPSWGNRKFSKHQFLAMWETRDDELLKGKILLFLPEEADTKLIKHDFFGLSDTANLAVELLTMGR